MNHEPKAGRYLHGYSRDEQRRLVDQAEYWRDRLILPDLPYGPGHRLLDVGCGSGILALAAARLGMRAFCNYLDSDAFRAAVEAAAVNQLATEFSIAPLGSLPASWPGSFDLVVANLYAEVLAMLAPELLALAAGPIACAGILADRAQLGRDALGSRPIRVDETLGDDAESDNQNCGKHDDNYYDGMHYDNHSDETDCDDGYIDETHGHIDETHGDEAERDK